MKTRILILISLLASPVFLATRARAVLPSDLSLIDSAGKSFHMGDGKKELLNESWPDFEKPVRRVIFTNDIYMGKTEVTYAQWKEVWDWALGHGYDAFGAVGQIGAAGADGLGRPDTAENRQHPVTNLSWNFAAIWCNARSEKEGLTPCYTVRSGGTVYRSTANVAIDCNWEASGYRLPTIAEWEYAARGGVDDGRRFPWGDEPITHARANYRSNWDAAHTQSYDQSPTSGYHPLYNGTAPVGSFPATGFGLYDMAGNVDEWCWDWFPASGTTFYTRPDPETDPHGDIVGTYRDWRSGCFGNSALALRCAFMDAYVPYQPSWSFGFRVARNFTGIRTQPMCTSVTSGATASLTAAATGGDPAYQWYCGGKAVAGGTSATLVLLAAGPSAAGIYDVVATSGGVTSLSRPAVLGVLPPAGSRTAGAISTRPEWQNIVHPNGNIYDQYLLTGSAGTFSADVGEIARMSYLDPNGSIVQVEMSGAGATTVTLDGASGPAAPALYNQTGIHYMQGKATVIVAGADESTHLSMYSVGTRTNPGVTRGDVAYAGWADVAALGIVSADGGLGGLHQGNASYSSNLGFTGVYAPTVRTVVGSPVVVHEIAASDSAIPYLYFGSTAHVAVKIAGGALAQPGGDNVTVSGLARVTMGAGQDSCGRAAPATPIQSRLVNDDGTDVSASVVDGP